MSVPGPITTRWSCPPMSAIEGRAGDICSLWFLPQFQPSLICVQGLSFRCDFNRVYGVGKALNSCSTIVNNGRRASGGPF